MKTRYRQAELQFLWRQWSQLGAAGEVGFWDRWIIDPETLLLFTLDVGRYDPRLFDEVVDWCLKNGQWLSVQRLKNLLAREAADDTKRIAAALAQYLTARRGSQRWARLAESAAGRAEPQIALFLSEDGGQLPLMGPPEPSFALHGMLRPPISPRGMSRQVPTDPPSNLLFKLRALFGVGARAEVLGYLLTHPGGHASEIARATAYAQPSVQEIMAELTQAGLVSVTPAGGEKVYSLDIARWRAFLRLRPPVLPHWVDWFRAFSGFSLLRTFLEEERFDRMSDYLLQSRLRSITEDLARTLSDTGFPAKVAVPPVLSAAVPVFRGNVERIIKALTRLALPGPGRPSQCRGPGGSDGHRHNG